MPNTQWNDALDAVVAALATVTVANGYSVNLNVEEWESEGNVPTAGGASALVEWDGLTYGDDGQRENAQRFLPDTRVVVRLAYYHDTDAKASETQHYVAELVGDVLNALLADRELGGAAYTDFRITDVAPYTTETYGGDLFTNVDIGLRIPISHGKQDVRVVAD